jgi:hypothetical protein
VSGDGGGHPGLDWRCDGPGAVSYRRQVGSRAGRRPRRNRSPDRKGRLRRQASHAELRSRELLRRRTVQTLRLQEIHRRPPCIRAGKRRRPLRRRSGQFQLSALRPRRFLPAPLRRWTTGGDARPFEVERFAPNRQGTGPRGRRSRIDQPPAYRRSAGDAARGHPSADAAAPIGTSRSADLLWGARRRRAAHRRPGAHGHRERFQGTVRRIPGPIRARFH